MSFVNSLSATKTAQVISKMETTSSGVSIQGALDATAIGNNLIDIVYPIGFIITTFTNTNPSTLLANTTWVRFGEGKCVVGVDDTDADFASGATGGEKEHTLTKAEIPPHAHNESERIFNTNGAYTNDGVQQRTSGGLLTSTTGDGSADGLQGNAHNNLQPYISCYMWRRTA